MFGGRGVAHQHVGPPRFERLERVGDIGGRAHLGPSLLQHRFEQVAAVGVLVEHQHTQAVERRTPYNVNYRIRLRDGSFRWFNVRGAPVVTADGNVKEWTQDCFHEGQGYRGAPADGSAWTSGDCRTRVLRGGSWLSYARLLRAAVRFRGGADDRVGDVGFRAARTLVAP